MQTTIKTPLTTQKIEQMLLVKEIAEIAKKEIFAAHGICKYGIKHISAHPNQPIVYVKYRWKKHHKLSQWSNLIAIEINIEKPKLTATAKFNVKYFLLKIKVFFKKKLYNTLLMLRPRNSEFYSKKRGKL